MPRVGCRPAVAGLLSAALSLAATGAALAQAAPLARSAAFPMVAHFDGTIAGSVIPSMASVSGVFPKAYAERASEPLFFRSVPLAAGAGKVPGLTVVAHGIAGHVRGGRAADREISVEADSAIGSVLLELVPFRGGIAVGGAPALKLVAHMLRAGARFSRLGDQQVTDAGTAASIDSLSISGPLVGNRTLTFAGVPAAEMVLFQSPTVTITLNDQVAGLLEVCDAACRTVVTAVVAGAVDIRLSGAGVFGSKVTGEIVFGLVRGSEE